WTINLSPLKQVSVATIQESLFGSASMLISTFTRLPFNKSASKGALICINSFLFIGTIVASSPSLYGSETECDSIDSKEIEQRTRSKIFLAHRFIDIPKTLE